MYFTQQNSLKTIKTRKGGMSSVRYGTRLGDLKNKQSTERVEIKALFQ